MLKRGRVFLMALALLACERAPEKIVARVGSHEVGFDAYLRRYKEYLFNSAMKDNLVTRKQVAQNMVHEYLLKYYDDNRSVEANPAYQKEVRWAENQMILGYLKDSEIYARITADEQEVRRAFYRSNVRVAARHLYAPTKEKADALYRALQNGADFEALAREAFTDSTLKNNGGYLGYIRWGDMDPAFEDTAYSLQPGQYSRPVKTAQGYSIIKVEDRKAVPVITENQYLNARKGIERIVRINKMKPAEQAFLKQRFDEVQWHFYQDGLEALIRLSAKTNMERPDDIPVAAYGETTFNLGDVARKLEQLPDNLKASIVDIPTLKAAVKGLLIQERLLREARDKGYDEEDIVRRKMTNARTNVYLKFKFREIVARYQTPDSLLRAYYQKHIDDFRSPRRMAVSEIVTDGLEKALDIKERLLAGASFEDMARRYSLRTWSARRGGDMGLSDWERYGLLKEKLWQAPLNRVLGPWEVQKFHVLFKVTRRVASARQPFEALRDEVEARYKKEYEWKIIFTYLNDLYKKTTVTYNTGLIKSFVLKENPDRGR
ncbi:MAG: hypothetical protein D6677_00610 [Calditrichaeota bacterium]|nr:MAG: hypothetical protein D6677_00610 [Calditrichota bacterium]